MDFIGDKDYADAAIKAVLGILASSMEETEAQKFAEKLPEQLDLKKLRGHQEQRKSISPETYVNEVANQFYLTRDQARPLINKVLEYAEKVTGIKLSAFLKS